MRGPPLRRDLAEPSANLITDLGFHQLSGDQRDRLAHEILEPTIAHLRDDIGNHHAVTFGHRGVSPFVWTARTADEFGATVADPLSGSTNPTLVTPLLPVQPVNAPIQRVRVPPWEMSDVPR